MCERVSFSARSRASGSGIDAVVQSEQPDKMCHAGLPLSARRGCGFARHWRDAGGDFQEGPVRVALTSRGHFRAFSKICGRVRFGVFPSPSRSAIDGRALRTDFFAQIDFRPPAKCSRQAASLAGARWAEHAECAERVWGRNRFRREALFGRFRPCSDMPASPPARVHLDRGSTGGLPPLNCSDLRNFSGRAICVKPTDSTLGARRLRMVLAGRRDGIDVSG